MPSYFIEMGQGIVAKSNDLLITTSTLHTCTFIAGFNAQVGYAGAFHYPAGYLRVRYRYEYPEDAPLTADGIPNAPMIRRPIHNRTFRRKDGVVNNMTDWIRTLRPTMVVLVFGSTIHATGDMLGERVVEKDFRKVRDWVLGHCPNAVIRTKMEANAAMIVADGKMGVSSTQDLESRHRVDLSNGQINLQNMLAGRYPGYTLFGQRE
ncbi:hypothetical protein [Dyella nitratireducens]|uniref:Uncharacterized protein n=1 Tax=Dyella nitratireducens TaxID=1849580 RepID=A0ABQ1FKR1_9GAMM|nr:hypothetical protein [Dyella nitratireducens]GGA16906.1 hypothetical protein GCM10010981_00780 [Dyella nitratireducens]GLQ44861.1 hypothetical protein GCM10007902_47110 [Dyella nitratireducens]